MKKIIKEVDEKRGIVQVTVSDERWYLKNSTDEASGIPVYKGVPSVTWIAGFYPKGVQFYKWLAEKGWDEAEAIKVAAGDKGSAVHLAIEMILNGEEFRIDTKISDKTTGGERELTFEELECVFSFIQWRKDIVAEGKIIESIRNEFVIFSDQYGYAGTVDWLCRIDGQLYLIDFKTGQSIWREYELQVSAYRVAIENGENPIEQNDGLLDVSSVKTAILQLGYRRNKNGYKFTEVENAFDLFLMAKAIWQREAGDQEIKKRDFPIILSPAAGVLTTPVGELSFIKKSKPKKK